MNDRYAIILCGGSGSRLWPLSRSLKPKQLLALNGEKTLLQQTALRLSQQVSAANLITVTHDDHRFEVKGQLAEILPTAVTGVMAEPTARDTLPAIAWATYQISLKNPNALVSVFPSDHAIDNEVAFFTAWQTAENAAQAGYFTLLGITPTEPATGYGYIKPVQTLANNTFEVAAFVEKPDLTTAQSYVENGYLWNSGMFVFKADVFLGFMAEYQPDMLAQIKQLSAENITENYKNLASVSIDYGLAEKLAIEAKKIAVVPVDMGWSDLGSWDSIFQRREKTAENNVVQGDVLAIETADCLLWNAHGYLATLGVSNLAVIQTADATLICDKSRTEDIKRLVTELQIKRPELVTTHRTVQRPWGEYTVLEDGEHYKIKRIVLKPLAKLSLQMHNQRAEHWVVIDGVAKITNGDKVILLKANESTYIPKKTQHRLENPSDSNPLSIIEVQCGEYVGEDDIVRFEDIYGRLIA